MAQELKLYQKCPQCNGTGVHEGIKCLWPDCNGTGFIFRIKCFLDPGVDDVISDALLVLNNRLNLLRVYTKKLSNKCDAIETKCEDLDDKCDDVLDKCDDILEKLEN
jgi:hypothetical protein